MSMLFDFTSERQERKKFRGTHKVIAPEEKYLPSSGNTVSLDSAISSVVRIAANVIQREPKAMDRPGQILIHQRKRRVSLERQYRKNVKKMHRLPKPKTISRGSLISLLRAPSLMKRSGLKDSASG
jgi:hypothetical protein